MIVVKIGGSLLDHPQLRQGLRLWLETTFPSGESVLLIPGGGPAANIVRTWDSIHHLGEEAAHWLAIGSLAMSAALLQSFLPEATITSHPGQTRWSILDVFTFCEAHDNLPHHWDVTTDSIAAHAAWVFQAKELMLLKSVPLPTGVNWPTAARNGLIDQTFPGLVEDAAFAITWVDFRDWLRRFA